MALTPTTLRLDKKCGKSGIPDNRKCTKATTNTPQPYPQSAPPSTGTKRTLLTAAGVTTVGAVLGVLAKDVFTSGLPADKVPPMEDPPGLYDTFKPGDLIYQSIDFLGARRAHYAVYLGKKDGVHQVFDVSPGKGSRTAVPMMKVRSIQEAKNNGSSFAKAERVSKNTKQPTAEQLNKLVAKLNDKSYDWVGFERNCETFARTIVNDLPVSTQTKGVTQMTQSIVTNLISALAPNKYRRRAFKQQNVRKVVEQTYARDEADTPVITPTSLRLDLKCGNGSISEGETCHKGSATPTQPKKKGQRTKLPKMNLTEGALTIGGLGLASAGAATWVGSAVNEHVQYAKTPEKGKDLYLRLLRKQQTSLNSRAVRNVAGIATGIGLAIAGAGLATHGTRTGNRELANFGTTTGSGGLLSAAGSGMALNSTLQTKKNVVTNARKYKNEISKNRRTAREFKNWAEEFTRRAKAAGARSQGRTRSNTSTPDPYKDLGVNENMSSAEIRRKWREAVAQNHPDRGGDPEKAKRINAAWAEIKRRRGEDRADLFTEGFDFDWDSLEVAL